MTRALSHDFLVDRKDLRRTQLTPAPDPLETTFRPGYLLLKVDSFALTANNITYAVFGDAMQYWNFFPAPAGWGRVPVWGYATVVQSAVNGIENGERLFGYLPMSTHLMVKPERVTPAGFMDASEHRRPLPSPYQLYRRLAHDPGHEPGHEDARALLYPLFITSFMIEDFLADNDLFGARRVVIASASSKTALGLAWLLQQRHGENAEVVGLTSPGNVGFCESVGYYSRVLSYDKLESLTAVAPTVYVDMAGDGKLLARVHQHFDTALKHSCIVGATHWEARATQHQMPGPKPQFFFAPTQIKKRTQDWGPGGVDQHYAESWKRFLPSTARWLKLRHDHGPEAVQRAYLEILEGKSRPELGLILSWS